MPGPKARTFNHQAGDVGYVPVGGFRYIQNTGDETLIYLECSIPATTRTSLWRSGWPTRPKRSYFDYKKKPVDIGSGNVINAQE